MALQHWSGLHLIIATAALPLNTHFPVHAITAHTHIPCMLSQHTAPTHTFLCTLSQHTAPTHMVSEHLGPVLYAMNCWVFTVQTVLLLQKSTS